MKHVVLLTAPSSTIRPLWWQRFHQYWRWWSLVLCWNSVLQPVFDASSEASSTSRGRLHRERGCDMNRLIHWLLLCGRWAVMTSHWAANYHATLALRELMPQSWPECNCCEYFSFIIWKIADGGCQNDVELSFDVIFPMLIPWLTVETRHVYVHVVCSMLTRYRFYHNRVIGANFEVSCEIVSININFADSDKASDNSLINYSKNVSLLQFVLSSSYNEWFYF